MGHGRLGRRRFRFLIGRMRQALDGFERGAIALGGLAADVESVIDALFDVADNEWVERLRSAWAGLEITHAVALDEARPALSDEDGRVIGAAFAELRSPRLPRLEAELRLSG